MADEYFYAVTLDKAGSTVTWENVGNTKEFPSPFYKLVIKQFLLGHNAKDGEYNTVEVETTSSNDTVKVPVAVLKSGETRSISTFLEFPDAPVTFKLVEGNGPVYILGQHVPGNYEIDATTVLSEEELDEEEEEGESDEEKGERNSKENCKNDANRKRKRSK